MVFHKDVLIPLSIYVMVPLLGVWAFIFLTKRIKKENLLAPPFLSLFFTFLHYGGIFLVILTELFWKWSGMASIGTFYLFLGGPVISAITAFSLSKYRWDNPYYTRIYQLSILYIPLLMAFMLLDSFFP